LHSPRIAVFHPPGFRDLDLVLELLKHPRQLRADPEIVLIRPWLLKPHFLDGFLRDNHWHYTSFSPDPTSSDPQRWFDVMVEAAAYATHLLVYYDHEPGPLHDFLFDDEIDKPPIKMIVVDKGHSMS